MKNFFLIFQQRKEAEKLKFVSNRDDLIRLTTRVAIDQKDKDDDIPPLIKVKDFNEISFVKFGVFYFYFQVLTSSHDCRERIEKSRETVVAVVKRRKKFLDELKSIRNKNAFVFVKSMKSFLFFQRKCSRRTCLSSTGSRGKNFQKCKRFSMHFKTLCFMIEQFQITFRISDITLANFYFQSSFLLTSFPTIFNNYFGDIDDETVAYLDRNLHIGQQIKEVYEQLLSTIDLKRSFQLDTVSFKFQRKIVQLFFSLCGSAFFSRIQI